MKRFQFSLDRVLDWRLSQLAVAENQLFEVEQEKHDVGFSLSVLKATLEGDPAAALDPAAAGYRSGCEAQFAELADRFTRLRHKAEEYRALLIKMRRDCRLLETLRDQRRTEWKVDFERHQEQLSAEVHQALRYLSGREALQGAEVMHEWRRRSA